jgi:hypothetical protein
VKNYCALFVFFWHTKEWGKAHARRNMKKIIMLFVLLLGLLSACVPAMSLGGSPSNPIDANFGLPSERVMPGSTWYFVTQYNPEAFGYGLSERNRQLNGSFAVSSDLKKGQKGSSTISNGFTVKNVDTPAGWEVRIQRVYLQREVMEVDYSSYSFGDSMHFVFAVTVPKGTARGVETIMVTVQHGTTSQKIPLMVLIDSDQPQATPACDDCPQS